MYSPTAYYFACWFASTLNLLFYPVFTSLISFWSLDFEDSSFSNWLNWMSVLMLAAIQGATIGFMFGCIFPDIHVSLVCIICYLNISAFGSGILINLKEANWLIKIVGWLSPFRYSNESLYSVVLEGRSYKQEVLDFYGFDIGYPCIYISTGFFIGYLLIGWFALVMSSKKL